VKKPGRESWLRDVARVFLFPVAIVFGVALLTGTALAIHYRKHIQAVYWARRWAREDKPPFDVFEKVQRGMPRQTRIAAWLTAYENASNKNKRLAALGWLGRSGGTRELYELAKRAGPDSMEEKILLDHLHDIAHLASNDLARAGFTSVRVDDAPPTTEEAEEIEGHRFGEKDHIRYEFGSYRASCSMDWYQVEGANGKKEWRAHHSPTWLSIHVERLPGPWRDLPPIPPPRPPDNSPL